MEISSAAKRYLNLLKHKVDSQKDQQPTKYIPLPIPMVFKPTRTNLHANPGTSVNSPINSIKSAPRTDKTFIIRSRSDAMKENTPDIQFSFMTSDYFSNCKSKSPYTENLFSPPPVKRMKVHDGYTNFFETQSNVLASTINMPSISFMSQTSNKMTMQSLFGESSIASTNNNHQMNLFPLPSSFDSFDVMSIASQRMKQDSFIQNSADSSAISIISSRASRLVEKYSQKENRFVKLISADSEEPFEITIDMDYGKTHKPTTFYRKEFQETKEEIPTFDKFPMKSLDRKIVKKVR